MSILAFGLGMSDILCLLSFVMVAGNIFTNDFIRTTVKLEAEIRINIKHKHKKRAPPRA